jgi:hypothetical protein
MAYTIVKSDGTVLTTIADGTINTTSTSLGLPGRNYAGYGQSLDTNFVHVTENFADNAPPPNPLRGQLWFNTNDSTLYVCPTDGESNALAWLALTATSSGGTTTFGEVNVTGNVTANNLAVTNDITADEIATNFLTVSIGANIGNASLTGTTTVSNLVTTVITTGANTNPGSIIGTWTLNGGGNISFANSAATSLYVTNGDIVVNPASNAGIRTDNLMYANGANIFGGGAAYSNANVAAYLPNYGGVVFANVLTVGANGLLTTGANTNSGNITGNWTLTAGSRLQATYADLAERFEAEEELDPGTVVELGGSKEIRPVVYELSEDVFGVISNTAAYLMNAGAGDDKTHPPVAVSGRVQVKVTGIVNKGDRLVSAGNGIARAAKKGEAGPFNTIGRALEAKDDEGLGHVEAIVTIK